MVVATIKSDKKNLILDGRRANDGVWDRRLMCRRKVLT